MKVVDLSHCIEPGSPVWPGDPPVEVQTVATTESHGYYLRRFAMGEHSGTHVNAPCSFHPGGATIADYPPEALVAPAVVVDVRSRVSADPDYVLSPSDVAAWERQHGPVPQGAVVLLQTGWDAWWGQPERYVRQDGDGRLHFPGFGIEAVQQLIAERRIGGVGIDGPGVDPGSDTAFSINRLVLAADPARPRPRLVLENLTNLARLPATGVTLVVGILRLRGGSGSPASVLAFAGGGPS